MIVIHNNRCVDVILTKDDGNGEYAMWDGRSSYGMPRWDKQRQRWNRESGGLIESIPESTAMMIFTLSRPWMGGKTSIRRYVIGTQCTR